MRPSIILSTTARFVVDASLVLSVYLLFAGHNQPGGGFVGGRVAAAALALRYLAEGPQGLDRLPLPATTTLLSAGLVLAAGSALVPLLAGSDPLDHRAWSADLAVLGYVKFTTAAIFDTGVYLVVVALGAGILRGLGDLGAEPATDGEEAP